MKQLNYEYLQKLYRATSSTVSAAPLPNGLARSTCVKHLTNGANEMENAAALWRSRARPFGDIYGGWLFLVCLLGRRGASHVSMSHPNTARKARGQKPFRPAVTGSKEILKFRSIRQAPLVYSGNIAVFKQTQLLLSCEANENQLVMFITSLR